MNCHTVRDSLSAHLDGVLSDRERQDVLLHVGRCRECESHLQQVFRLRAALRRLPVKAAPPELTTALRVTASKERQRVLDRRRRFERLLVSFHLWADGIMRPMALPFAGGLVSALILFAMLVPTFALHRTSGNDVPVALFTEPSIKAQMPFPDEFGADIDCVLEVIVDGQGRMVDYSVARGDNLSANPELRREIEKKLLFTEFTPATVFGQPTFGKVYVSFQRRHIEIKS